MSKYISAVVIMFSVFSVNGLVINANTVPCFHVWSSDLKIGSNNDDVLHLQKFLNSDTDTVVALSGIGSKGNETSYFGGLTANAVNKFQEKYADEILKPAGLLVGSGRVGPLTRAKLNSVCANVNDVSEKNSKIEKSFLNINGTDQPVKSIAPAGAGGVLFTSVILSAGSEDVEIKSITVEQSGPADDDVFESIGIMDENGNSIGDEEEFDAKHQVVFLETFVLPARSSKKITVYGNITDDVSNYVGQMPIIKIVAIDSSLPVEGSLPITGNGQIINGTLMIGGATATLSQLDPLINTNRYVNDTNIRFSGIRVTANSQEDLTLSSITWSQSGSASSNDFSNIRTVVNGIEYQTVEDARTYTSLFIPEIVIPRGQSVDLYIVGDLTTTGSNRTVSFDIDSSDDISLTGNVYKYGVGVSAGGNTAVTGNSVFITSNGDTDGEEGNPFFAGSIVTINSGTFVSVGNAN